MPHVSRFLGFYRRSSMIVATIVMSCATCVAADEIVWSTDIAASLEQSASVGRPVLMEFTAEWCVYCKRMESTTFADPGVAAIVNRHFLPVQVDADQYKDLVKQLQIKGLPAILVVGADLAILERISGFQTPEALLTKLERFTVSPAGSSTTIVSARESAAGQENSAPHARMATPASVGTSDAPPVVTADRRNATPPLPHVDLFGDTARAEQAATADTSNPFATDNPFAEPAARQPEESNPFDLARPERQVKPPVAQSHNPFAQHDEVWGNVPSATSSAKRSAKQNQNPFEFSSHAPPTKPPAQSGRNAFGGVCVVSAVDDREIVEGSTSVVAVYRGQQIAFRSEEYKQRFLSNPEKYWPMMDGICTVTLADSGQQVHGRYEFASVFRNRIWLFTSEDKMQQFLVEPAEMVEEALEQL